MAEVAMAAAAAVTWVSGAVASAGALVATSISVYTGVSIGTAIAVTNALGSLALNAGMAAVSSLLFAPNVERGGSPIQFKADPAAPISGVMGRFGVSGRQVHANTWGKDNLYMSFVVALSLGPIQGFDTFTANTLPVTFPGAQGLAANVEPYKDKMWQTRRLGLPTDTYVTIPTGVPDGNPAGGGTPFAEWTPAHTLPGFAQTCWTLKNNSKRASYESGVPNPLWTLLGMKLWDPRQDSTYPGGAGPQRRDDWRTWGYTANPYVHALAWSRGHFKLNADGSIDRTKRLAGVGAPDASVDIGAFVQGANVSDANGWEVAGEWTTVDDKWQVLAAMLQAGGGAPLNRGAMISCTVEAPRTSILTLTGEDIVGPVTLSVMTSRRDRPNTIVPRVRLEAQKFEEVALGAVTSSVYRDEDGGEPRTREIPYRYVGKAKQGAELAAYGLANARETLTASIPCKPYLLGVRAGDAFTVNEPELGLNGQKFVVQKRSFDPSSTVVTLEVRSETDAKHPWALGQIADPPATPALTPPATVSIPDADDWTLTAETFTDNGVSIPALVLSGAVSNDNVDTVNFEFRPVTTPEAPWASAGDDGPTVVRKEITGLTPGTQYEVAVTYKRGPGISERRVLGPVLAGSLIAGDVAPVTPANVAGTPSLAITTTIAPDGTQTSRLFGEFLDAADALTYVAEIDDGTLIQQVPLVESAIEDRIVTTGATYRYRVKGVSRTGTPSAAWSAWSASVLAGGDTTGPGPITPVSIMGGLRQIAMDWTNPTDDDFSHVIIYRDTLGTLAGAVSTMRADGSSFVDTATAVGTTYYYWARTVDRTGNMSAGYTYLGSAAARLTRFDTDLTLVPPRLDPHPIWGGDFLMTDRLVFNDGIMVDDLQPGEAGSNRTETRTAAAFQGQGLLATANTISVDSQLSGGMAHRLAPYPYDSNYLLADRVAWGGGQTVESLKPGEAGANITEARTAAAFTGQGLLATKNAAHFFNDTVGRPLVMQDGYFDGGGFFYADAIRNGGVQLNSRWPSEGGANVTENRTAAAIAGQTPWATLNVPTTHLTRPGSNLLFNGGMSLGLQGFVGPSVYGYDAETGHYIYFNANGRITDIYRCTPGQTMTMSGETFANAPGALIYLVFWGDVGLTDYKGEGAYFGANGYVRSAATPVVVPAGATYWTIHAYCADWGAGLMVIRKIKVENGNAGTPWSDEATNGALYRGGGTIDSLKPQEAGANVTEGRSAASFLGQTAWATLTRSIVSISRIDDTGRITDGQALPLNGMSKSSTLSPAHPFSAGTDPATQINIAASVATFAGGATLSMPSATVSGLTASTMYSFFRDLVAGTFVAVSSGAAAYFTSAQRYLFIGAQATQDVGGGYEPLPPPPPGSGGGYGDIPDYLAEPPA